MWKPQFILAAALWAIPASILPAQDPSPAPPERDQAAPQPAPTAQEPGPAPAGPGTEEPFHPLGPPLFPIYDHYLRTSDNTEVLNILYLYASTSNPAGDASNFLFPIYFWKRQVEPLDRRLFVFPLLFFHRSSAALSYNVSLPLYYDYRTPESQVQFLAPLWLRHRNVAEGGTSHHFLFPFSRLRFEEKGPGAPATRFRLGMWKILDLFESYSARDATRFSALSLFNFGAEGKSPLALFHSTSEITPEGEERSHTHLFPLFWRESSPEGGSFWLFPLFGYSSKASGSDIFLVPLLSRFGGSADGSVRRDILFPFYHRAYGPRYSSFFSLPFFDYSWTPDRRDWGLLGIVYRNEHYFDSGKTAHSVLWPLGRFDVEPDGVHGHRRLLPFYIDNFNERRRFRISPLFLNYQNRTGTTVNWSFNYAIPTYFGAGSADDYFGTGFPLYWQSRTGRSGWDLFLPVWFSYFRTASYGFHLLPLVSYSSHPSERQLLLGGPLFVMRRFYDFQGSPEGFSFSMPWPLATIESRPQGYHYRLLPLFWTSRDHDEKDLLLFPLWYRQWGGKRSQDYFFAAYGRYEDERLRRDFYGLGSYIWTREKDDKGVVFRSRHDILWSLLSFQKDDHLNEEHQRALPIGFWHTSSLEEDRTIVGPFYYGHRIEDNDTTHRLHLGLGNLWFSKEVDRERLVPPAPSGEAAAPAPPAGPAAPGEPGARRIQEVVSRERGLLWPLLRWGFDNQGNSSEWAAPFYFHRLTPNDETRAFFPLLFTGRDEGKYSASYFRYLFLTDWETWDNGYRFTLGYVLADWMVDREQSTRRWRLLYPLLEHQWGPEGYRYQVTPILQGYSREEGGQRESSHFLFPLFFRGAVEQRQADGAWTDESRYFYLFPLYGLNRKSLRTQHDFLLPFFHIEHGKDSFKFQLRPLFFYRDDPEELSVRLWPLSSVEMGESAGDWWVSKYLYLSKAAVRRDRWSYRLEPFLFRARSDPQEFGVGGLFELFAYDRKGSERSFRALPLTYSYSRPSEEGMGFFPLYYGRDFKDRPIDYFTPLRFPFLLNHLRGAGKRYTSLLGLLFEYEDEARRPDYSDLRFFFRLFQNTRSERSRTVALYPFFYYFRDDAALRKDFSLLFSLYWYQEIGGRGTHRLFFIPIARS